MLIYRFKVYPELETGNPIRLPTSCPSKGASRLSQTIGSSSSYSDGSEFEPTTKPRRSSSSRSFMSKPVHPVSFQVGTAAAKEAGQTSKKLRSPWWLELGISSEAGTGQWISATSSKCNLCERLLSQRSPWGSSRIVGSGDMPVAAVLSCRHVYHVECLEHPTPKNKKHNPPCPQSPRLKRQGEGGSSRGWTCRQVGDCVMRAVQLPKRSNVRLLDKNPVKRQLLLEGGSGKN
ncbi:Zinc finger RING/FYVE/PHD-type protein [Dioscorea alata]|uniref:Zinc finger RING/FYVE/PHD-type protein n=1 Tax=Dioscorea alata TaxID=55571 RepID=A0ACB7VYX4_DIOAL|nr:Zinc finger RING/FYVE/PHD-type protein [Dioscorea alata]